MLRVPALCLTAASRSSGQALPGSRLSTKKVILLLGWEAALRDSSVGLEGARMVPP